MTEETTYNPTAQKILDTAAYLFMQLGYRAVSINDIVKAAEITKPTLYYYFRDKQELFVQMAIQRLLTLNRLLTAAAERDGLAAQLLGMAEVGGRHRERAQRRQDLHLDRRGVTRDLVRQARLEQQAERVQRHADRRAGRLRQR